MIKQIMVRHWYVTHGLDDTDTPVLFINCADVFTDGRALHSYMIVPMRNWTATTHKRMWLESYIKELAKYQNASYPHRGQPDHCHPRFKKVAQ